jgi:predicted ATPase
LRRVDLDKLTPMTVLLDPNGSGKSIVFDVFNFLSECFQFGLHHAWDRRGRGKELKTRGATGPTVFALKHCERPGTPVITYHLAIDEGVKGTEVVEDSRITSTQPPPQKKKPLNVSGFSKLWWR